MSQIAHFRFIIFKKEKELQKLNVLFVVEKNGSIHK